MKYKEDTKYKVGVGTAFHPYGNSFECEIK